MPSTSTKEVDDFRLTPPRVGQMIRRTTSAVYSLIQRGELDARLTQSGRWAVSESSVTAFQRRQSKAPASAA